MSGSRPTSFGEMLRTFRIHAGLSQEALSDAAGVSVRTISDLERGQRHSAHLETVRLLSSALELTADERRLLLEAARSNGVPADVSQIAPARSVIGNVRWTATIPAPVTPLVGRANELDALAALLMPGSGIVTLTGPGGAGKTRLAIELAHRLAPAYADGAAFVELATVTEPELVSDAIERALGLTPRAGGGTDRLAALLSPRELLLVLDNLEQVIDSAPKVAQLSAACPHLTILVTSRVRLRVSGEREFGVPPLPLADANAPFERLRSSEAVQLFAERARRVDPQFALTDQNIAAASEICRRLDGLPLAIELAASRLRVLSAPALLERLDRRLPMLTGGDRDRPPRHQSMRGTIAWSYELLDPTTKRFLCWMSVFTGGLSLDSAEALGHGLGLDLNASLETVTTLVDYGLATRSGSPNDQPRFHLFETIREFALEQLAEAGELDHARRFHAEHFLAFASRDAPPPYEPIDVAWVGRLAGEHPNLLVAFDVLCEPETAQQSVQFAAAMGPYWHAHGPFSEWQPRLSRALALASPEPTIQKVHVLFWLSLILGASPDFDGARQVADRSIEMANQVGTARDQAAAIGIMAWVHECHGHWEIARELRNRSIELSESTGNVYMRGICLVMNAISSYALGDLARAQCEAEQGAEIFRASNSIDWSASTACTQGMLAVAAGQLALGASYYQQSLRIWIENGNSSRLYRPLVGLADVAAEIEHFASAARLLGAADAMLIVGGRDLPFFDRSAYSRALIRSQEALGEAEFDANRLAGRLTGPEAWIRESEQIGATI